MKNNPLTPEYSRFGTFDQLRENARVQLQDLITNLSDNPQSRIKGTNAQKVSDLYKMGMDSVRLNKEASKPLAPFIKKIDSASLGKKEFAELLAWIHNGITGSFFNSGVGSDAKNSDRNILHIGEVGLGLGDRDYYLEENEANAKILAAYETYVKRLMELIGYDEQSQNRVWNNVISIETEFAKHKMTREQRRNPQLRYNMRGH